jgi:gliding motility-associated-like protein
MSTLKKCLLLILFLLSVSGISFGQLITSTAYTPTQLVQNVLLGPGITASSVNYTGDAGARGFFNGTFSNIGLDSGIVLSSGFISNAIGPNNSQYISQNFSTVGDPDVSALMAPTGSFDAAILEFDFVPTSDTITFRYVFGSEEYMEFVGPSASFNDAFGFFISGPGISGPYSGGAENIALVPGTSLPVTMQNINLFSFPALYYDNGNGLGSGTAPDGATVQYDGFTVPLTAVAAVQCGQVYHIKLAIADGSDGFIDSGVFLEAGSFSSPQDVIVSTSSHFGTSLSSVDTLVYEGCGYASVKFDRGTNGLSSPDTVLVTYGGSAINGTDYSMVNDTVFFPAGQDTAVLDLITLPDMLVEGMETIQLTIYTSTPCGGNDTLTRTFYIVDSPPLLLSLGNDTLISCPLPDFPLTATVSGGVALGAYNFTWSGSSSTTDTAQVNPLTTTMYYCTVTDSCGNSVTDSLLMSIVPYTPLQLVMNADTTICGGDEVFLSAAVSAGQPDYTFSWNPNISVLDTVTVSPANTTAYVLTVTDACNYSISGTVNVTVYPINADFDFAFSTNQTVSFLNASSGAVSYLWNFGDGSADSASTATSPSHFFQQEGTYTVTLVATNIQGCADTLSYQILVLPDFYFYFPNAFTPNGNGNNDLYTGYGTGIKSYHMQIFNRWGEKVYETNDLLKGWDGTYQGTLVSAGVYVCRFQLEGYHYEIKEYIGHVNVIR